MRIALIADAFPPLRSSGAIQLRDLAREFVRQSHDVTVILPASSIGSPWALEDLDGVQVLRLKAPRTKDINYVQRTLAEWWMPYAMGRNLQKSPLASSRWDGVVWYAPSIFHGPLVAKLKRANDCKGYLILRDIFPEWAVDLGLMSRGLPYRFFRAVAEYQYSVADVIGVQTEGNRAYFNDWEVQHGRRLEVLHNWLGQPATRPCPIQLAQTALAGRKVFVYAGNMGVAQGMNAMLDLAHRLHHRADVGFLFVGRGSEAARLQQEAEHRQLSNVMFHDEIDPDDIPALYTQCYAGLVSLDPRHKTHNIPGKFLTYMQMGLPVLARVNAGSDLVRIIETEGVGLATSSEDGRVLAGLAEELAQLADAHATMQARCRHLFSDRFSADQAVRQIVEALQCSAT
jgi:glycosyltransferase involved in cell wall biosynthesis